MAADKLIHICPLSTRKKSDNHIYILDSEIHDFSEKRQHNFIRNCMGNNDASRKGVNIEVLRGLLQKRSCVCLSPYLLGQQLRFFRSNTLETFRTVVSTFNVNPPKSQITKSRTGLPRRSLLRTRNLRIRCPRR